ncbi:hypothetical protein J1N35_018478 [Gossypium stocksii]|uniref:Uncharacterized protein n=1 Tax=Gossypium stocksii TaxID=47602 RepID=A0A9D3VP32_9ROSI|nr:hypothetical protein J1N35_018478 [Gossypium stocksii]
MAKCKPISMPIALGEKLCNSENFQIVDEKNYRSLVGCLFYLIATRPDITFAVGLLPRFMFCYDTSRFKAINRVLRYVKGTTDFGVWFAMVNSLKLIGYTDSDWARLVDDIEKLEENKGGGHQLREGFIIDGFLLKKILNFGSLNHWQNLFKQREKKRVEILLSGGISMDCMATREKNTELDLEKGLTISEEEDQIKNPFSSLKNKAQMLLSKFSFSENVSSDERVSLSGDASDSGSTEAVNKEGQDNKGVIGKESNNDNKINNNNKVRKEKRNKKAPKPPRPPKAPTLDAADRRLIKELAELARLKRARIERMKALKKMKATKGISSDTTILAMVLIIILLIVIIYHGMESRGTSTKSGGSEMGVGGAMEGGLLSLELFGNPSSSISNTGSPLYVLLVIAISICCSCFLKWVVL